MSRSGGRPALFLDRDGTLIVDTGYPRDPALVALVPGALDALLALQRDYALVIVSNQSGVARGLVAPHEAKAVHERTRALYAAQGVQFAGSYYCFHAPEDGCLCRKPAPGMLIAAADELGLEISRSVMVGDKASDVEAGQRAGCARAWLLGEGASGWPQVLASLARPDPL